MKLYKIILTLFLFKIIQNSEIILNDENFEQIFKNNEINFTMVYANWCPHCQNIKSDFINFMKENNSQNKDLKVSMIEGDKNNKFSEKYKIEGYPTFILSIENDFIKYNGEPDIVKLKEWLDKKINLKFTKSKNIDNFNDKIIVCKPNIDIIKISILYYFYDNIIEKFDCEENFIGYLKNKKMIEYKGNNFNDLRKFIISNRFTTVNEANDDILKDIFKLKLKFVLIFKKDLEFNFNIFTEMLNLETVIVKYNGDLKNKFINESLGLNTDSALLYFNTITNKKFKYNKYFDSYKNILDLNNLVVTNKLSAFYLQEDSPSNDNKLLKKLVSSTFEKFISDTSIQNRLVLIWVNDENSPNSMKISKVFFDLLNTFEMVKDIFKNTTFGEIDLKKNELEYIEQGPIFLCFQNNKQQPSVYEDKNINKINIAKFISKCIGLDIIRILGLDAEF